MKFKYPFLKRHGWRGGFTLIELLVVVLIIGILAAIALPQYTKAVEKARITQLILDMNALQKGIDLYYLGNGFVNMEGQTLLDALDIQLSNGITCSYNVCNSELGGGWRISWIIEGRNNYYTVQATALNSNGSSVLLLERLDQNGWRKSCSPATSHFCAQVKGAGWTTN